MTRTWGLGHWVGWPCQASSSSSEGAKQAAAAGVSRHSEEGPTAEMELLPLPPCATAAPPGFSVIANRLISAGRLLSIRRQVA